LLIAGVAVLAVGAIAGLRSDRLAADLRIVYLPAADAVIHGDSPYPRLSDQALRDDEAYVYPPHVAVALSPLRLVSEDAAALVAVIAAAFLLIAAFLLLGVRDVRCYAACFLWAPTWQELDMASITAVLVLALAIAWRYRDGVRTPAIALGLAVSAKLFLWPVLVWSCAERRLRQCVYAITIGLLAALGAWALIGFKDLTAYPVLLRTLEANEAHKGYSLVGIASSLGMGPVVGHLAMVLVGGGLLLGCIVLGRRGEERRSFTLAVAATLALTPIAWLHYLLVLVVPLAIARPRFSAIWLLPALLWFTRHPMYPEGYERVLPGLVATIVVWTLVAQPETSARRASRTDIGPMTSLPLDRPSAVV